MKYDTLWSGTVLLEFQWDLTVNIKRKKERNVWFQVAFLYFQELRRSQLEKKITNRPLSFSQLIRRLRFMVTIFY